MARKGTLDVESANRVHCSPNARLLFASIEGAPTASRESPERTQIGQVLRDEEVGDRPDRDAPEGRDGG
jgi:hypothetical protein